MVKKIYPKSNFVNFSQEWEPKLNGVYFKSFLDGLDEGFNKKLLTHETKQILGACPKPLSTYDSYTQLVLGRVQSGKTTSFNSVIALALDNEFDLVILLGGRSNKLLQQNRDELRKNLSPKNKDDDCYILSSHDEDGGSKAIPSFSIKPIKYGTKYVFVIMKQQHHIDALTKLLSAAGKELKDVNTLIIDDEADNASLNTLIKSDNGFEEESRIYNSIKKLRQSIPRHSLLQYTATPQSLLLTSATDQYRPRKARFVSPGEGYIGNSDLFYENSNSVVTVQEDEGYIKKFDEPIDELPDQFLNILNVYLLVCAEKFIKKDTFDKNVTMLVHPSSSTKAHKSWGVKIRSYLKELDFDNDEYSIDFFKKYEKKFKRAYNELTYNSQNVSEFKSLYELIPKVISHVIGQVKVLNSEPDSDNNLNWDFPFYILVGGNMLDRGFVVKGLTITYMPRGKGQGNIDTIQQRGRFFGYKKKYIDYVKIWLKQDTIDVFSTYAEHEQLLWEDLKLHSLKDSSLDEWKRRFLIDPNMKLTRDSVIGREISSSHISSNNWYFLRRPLQLSQNETILTNILSFSDYSPYPEPETKKPWTNAMRSLISKEKICLFDIIQQLHNLRIDDDADEAIKWNGNIINLSNLAESGYKAKLILIGTDSPELSNFQKRKRDKSFENNTLRDLFQGKNEEHDYPGADNLYEKDSKVVNIQVHLITKNDKNLLSLAFRTNTKRYIASE